VFFQQPLNIEVIGDKFFPRANDIELFWRKVVRVIGNKSSNQVRVFVESLTYLKLIFQRQGYLCFKTVN
jgi:hypothetical protein